MLRREMEEMGGEATVRPVFEAKHPLGRILRARGGGPGGSLSGLRRFGLYHRDGARHRRRIDGRLKQQRPLTKIVKGPSSCEGGLSVEHCLFQAFTDNGCVDQSLRRSSQ
jgi:hypothetical protein